MNIGKFPFMKKQNNFASWITKKINKIKSWEVQINSGYRTDN